MTNPESQLGEFEQLVLLAVLRAAEDAYAVSIRREIEQYSGRKVSRGALYLTLERMEQKGLLRSWLGEPTPERGGRPKRYYAARPPGIALLRRSRLTLLQMWRGLENKLGDA